MKKTSILALLIVAGLAVNAQRADFGVKGGVNLSSWSNKNDSRGFPNRTGFHAGLFSQIHMGPNIALQPELVYSSQGTKYYDGDAVRNLQMNYLNIPVMVQAKVGGGFYAQAGPQLGFLLNTKDRPETDEPDYFVKDDFKSTDVALGFGLGYTSASALGIDARYNLGLTNINADRVNNIKNNTLQIGLTYRLGSAASRRY